MTIAPIGQAVMNYIADMAEPPFVDVVNREKSRMSLEAHRIDVHDARAASLDLSLDREGFTVVRHATRLRRQDFANTGHVHSVYLREMERLVQGVTGADLVISARQPIVRMNGSDKGTNAGVPPAPLAHSDYTQFTLDRQLGYEVPLDAPAFRQFSQVVAYQTWRALSPPPQDNTLMFCDASTVSRSDRVVAQFAAPPPYAETLEFYMYKFNPAHRWYCYPALAYDEVLLFKGFEGDGEGKLNVLHGAADVPGVSGSTVPRESIETRAFAFFK